MNRITQKLQEDKKILSIYFSAGYPNLNDTVQIIQDLEKNGVDLIEIGLPFSDPLADGPTIQASVSRSSMVRSMASPTRTRADTVSKWTNSPPAFCWDSLSVD